MAKMGYEQTNRTGLSKVLLPFFVQSMSVSQEGFVFKG
jgi:hypothetical protein